MAHRRPHHSIRLNLDNSPRTGSWLSVMYGRPFYRFIPLLVACLFVLWILFAPFSGSPIPPPFYKPYQSESGKRPQQYPPPRPYPPPPRPNVAKGQWEERAQRVRDAFLHAWNGYQKYAAGWDELLPVNGGRVNK